MSKFDKYKKGVIKIEIQSPMPEKFINLIWRNGVQIKNIQKISITTMQMQIDLKDFSVIKEIADKTKTRLKILDRKGLSFILIKARRRIALLGGVLIFTFMLYYLSGFIWKINIDTEKNISPYEVRQQLSSLGVAPGMKKSSLNVYQLQDLMVKKNGEIMYFRARTEGARLFVKVVDKVDPPIVVNETTPCNLVAKVDGQIKSVYTSAGSPAVKTGDIVRAGQLLVKGEQGKEGSTYQVHAKGVVVAQTYHELVKEVPVKGVKTERTGNMVENFYIELFGKKLYFKNTLNEFKKYDKIVENSKFIKKELYYETKENRFNLDVQKVTSAAAEELYQKIAQSFDKSVKIIDKKVDAEPAGDNYRIRVLVTAEEDIAVTEKLQ